MLRGVKNKRRSGNFLIGQPFKRVECFSVGFGYFNYIYSFGIPKMNLDILELHVLVFYIIKDKFMIIFKYFFIKC